MDEKPKGKTWHIQNGHEIVRTGTGLRACASWNRDKAYPAVERLVDKIIQAATDNVMADQRERHTQHATRPTTATG